MARPAVLALALAMTVPAAALADDPADDDAADDDDGYDTDAMSDLVPVTARARLVGRVVVIDATFELTAQGPLPPPGVQRSITLPHDAVITGATVRADGRARKLQLVTHDDADKKLQVLFEKPGPQGERMSAVRIDADVGSDVATVELVVPRRTLVRLDVSLEVSTCFADDARNVIVPETWLGVLAGGNLVTGAADRLDDVCNAPSDVNPWIAFPVSEYAKRPHGEARIDTHGVRLPLGAKDVARVEISIAKELSAIPADLHTVLVVDQSRSATEDELELQRAIVASYLRVAPRSRVQLVGYTREARTLLPGWMIAGRATERIDRELRASTAHNGSNLDRGLAAAATLLASTSGTRRIILFTDDLFPDRIAKEVADYASSLPAGTLVHVVALHGFEDRLARVDDHALQPLAGATEGVVFSAGLDDAQTIDAMPLARPISFDNLSINARGWRPVTSDLECAHADRFGEGESCAWLGVGDPASTSITVEGWLWGTKVTRVIEPSERESRSLARLLSRFEELSTDLTNDVQRAALAVNDAWSLVAMWGRGGYGDLEVWGTFGMGRFGTIGNHITDGIGDPGIVHLKTDELRAQLSPALRACKARGIVSAKLELTEQEIVGVTLTPRDARDSSAVTCIEEHIWDTLLSLSEPQQHVTVGIELQP